MIIHKRWRRKHMTVDMFKFTDVTASHVLYTYLQASSFEVEVLKFSLSPLRRLVFVLRLLCPHGTCAKPVRSDTMNTSQQSSEVVAAAAVTNSDAPEVVAAGTGACLFSSSPWLLLLLLLLSTRGCRESV